MEPEKESNEILELFYKGDSERATKHIYKKVFPLVKRYILNRGGNKDDAFDVFQDALVSLYKLVSTKKYDEKYNILGFVYNLSLHKWFNKIKRDTKIEYIEEISNYDYSFESNQLESNSYLDKEQKLLDDFFSKIGDKCKEMLNYTIFKDLSLDDVMVRMGFPTLAAVKMQHKRCKEKVLEELTRNPKLLDKLKSS